MLYDVTMNQLDLLLLILWFTSSTRVQMGTKKASHCRMREAGKALFQTGKLTMVGSISTSSFIAVCLMMPHFVFLDLFVSLSLAGSY